MIVASAKLYCASKLNISVKSDESNASVPAIGINKSVSFLKNIAPIVTAAPTIKLNIPASEFVKLLNPPIIAEKNPEKLKVDKSIIELKSIDVKLHTPELHNCPVIINNKSTTTSAIRKKVIFPIVI